MVLDKETDRMIVPESQLEYKFGKK